MIWGPAWSERLRRAYLAVSPPSQRLERDFRYQLACGKCDPVLSRFPLDRHLPGRAIDVGANRGSYTYAFAQVFDAVESFEPQPGCAIAIERYAKTVPHVRVHRLGLSDTRMQAALHVPIVRGRFREHRATGLATLGPVGGKVASLTIDVATLDEFEFDDVALIKIDVEGHENAVIAGAERTIARSRPTLIVEIEQRHLGPRSIFDVFARIVSLGYCGWFFRSDTLYGLEDFSVERDQQPFVADIAAGLPSAAYANNFVFEPIDRRRPRLFAP